MNKTNRILVLIFAALVVAVWAFESPFQKSGYELTESKEAPLFPGFDETRVARVEIRKGEESAMLKKDASGTWVVENHFGYKANEGRIRGLLSTIARMNNEDLVDRNPSDLEKPYNLGPLGGVEIRAVDASGSVLAGLTQGRIEGDFKDPDFQRRMRKMPSYVRKLDGGEVYLVSEFTPVLPSGKDWLETSLMRFDAAKVNEIQLSGTAVEGDILLKKTGEEWEMIQPESVKAKKDVAESMARSLSSAYFKELVGTLDDPALYELQTPQLQVRMKLESGEEHALWVGKQLEDKSYFVTKGQGDRFVYQVHSFAVDALKKTPADLKDVPPPPAPEPVAEPAPVSPGDEDTTPKPD